MSTVDLNWFAVTALLKIHTEPRKRKKILYGIHQRHPAKFTPYNTVAVYNIPPGDKYENIKKLNEHLEHMPSICSFWYPELRLDESKYPEDTLFIGLAGDDVSNVLDHLPKVRDFGNVLVGERFTQQESSDIFGKLKMFSHIYMQIGLFDEVVVFRVGSRVSNTQYQEFRWVLDREIFYKPPDTDAGNPRIFTLKLSPACSCIEPEKHGDITSPEGQTINSITGMITSIIRDTLSREKGRVGFEFMLQYNKHDQSFREMLDPESRPPTEYWSDDGYPAIDSGSSSGSEPQEGSQSDNESHYHRTDTEPDQDLSRSRELSCSTSSSEDEDLSRSRELETQSEILTIVLTKRGQVENNPEAAVRAKSESEPLAEAGVGRVAQVTGNGTNPLDIIDPRPVQNRVDLVFRVENGLKIVAKVWNQAELPETMGARVDLAANSETNLLI